MRSGHQRTTEKRIVRTLIEEIMVDVDGSQGELILTLHGKAACIPKYACHAAGEVSAVPRLRVS